MPKSIRRNLNLCFTKTRDSPQNDTSVIMNNFNTLYDPAATSSSDSDNYAYGTTTTPPDFATVVASQRFFFSSPGRSNSIIESSSSLSSSSLSSKPTEVTEVETVIGGGIPIPTFSPDPYLDFRQSMQEMVESQNLVDVRANWDYLHELLMCYLSLNPKSTHKFIVGAFADLLLSMMPAPATAGS